MYKQIVEGLARDTVNGAGCTGGFERKVRELIEEWREKYGKEDGDDNDNS